MLSHELFFCVSVELSSRAVASQVFSPLQRLTSVFGMGTGGPTALETLTSASSSALASPDYLNTQSLGLVHLRGLEPRTHWLRVSCSTSWAKGASRGTHFYGRLFWVPIENRIKEMEMKAKPEIKDWTYGSSSTRSISISQLNALLHVHLWPIKLVVCKWPYLI